MPKNFSQDRIDHRFVNEIVGIKKIVKEQRMNQTSWQGYFPLPVRASDPAVTATGQFALYYNSSTGKVRKSYNGGAWTDTTI